MRTAKLCLAGLISLTSASVNATVVSFSNSNFTLLGQGGELISGATDVSGTFDDTKICFDESCTMNAMQLGSRQVFSGSPWTVHDIRVFGPGSYTFETCLPDGSSACTSPNPLRLTVGPGQLGAHMLFDWNTIVNTDIALLWDTNGSFGDPIFRGFGSAYSPLSPLDGSSIWGLVSRDANGDGTRGYAMMDGVFPGFSANFNLIPSNVPVPAAVWLFGSGLLGLIGASRKSKAA